MRLVPTPPNEYAPGWSRPQRPLHPPQTAWNIAEELENRLTRQPAEAHGFQINVGGNLQPGLQSGDLLLIRQFLHLAAGDQRLEYRCRIRGENGVDDWPIRKIG